MQYRSEIDGLRAIAVIPVILFHSGVNFFSGGFVGVDIFFVISGYLITTIITTELDSGTFQLTKFYLRRARRILPPLFIVMAACIPFAWIYLLPSEMQNFSQSLVAVSFFLSNVLFWSQSGYFDTITELKPLLHTWSLAIEEQFYFLFPVILLTTWRMGRKWNLGVIVVFSFVSLCIAHWGSSIKPSATFYLLPTRGWELGVGAMVALHLRNRGHVTPSFGVCQMGSILGLCLITYSVLFYDKQTPFPSLYTVVPVSGCALVILLAYPTTVVYRLLSTKAIVGMGLISYSAYLWHQPLLAFAKQRNLYVLNEGEIIAIVALSVLLAYLTWVCIEKPFRNVELIKPSMMLTVALCGSSFFTCFGLLGHFTEGFPSRPIISHLPKDYLKFAEEKQENIISEDGKLCISSTASMCKLRSHPGSLRILMIGDSHSSDYSSEYLKVIENRQLDAWQMSVLGCAFLPFQAARHNGECGKARQLLERNIKEHNFDIILFIAGMNGHISEIPEDVLDVNINSHVDLMQLISKSGANVIYFSPRPQFSQRPKLGAILNKLSEISVIQNTKIDKYTRKIIDLQKLGVIKIFDQAQILIDEGCKSISCFNGHTRDLKPLYTDSNHLTTFGANIVFSKLSLK